MVYDLRRSLMIYVAASRAIDNPNKDKNEIIMEVEEAYQIADKLMGDQGNLEASV